MGDEITIKDVKAFIAAHKDEPDVQGLVESISPLKALTADQAGELLESNETLRKARDSFADTRVTDGIKTYKDKHFDADYQERYTTEHPPESEADKRLRAVETELAEAKKGRSRETLRTLATRIATDEGLPVKLVDNFLGDDETATKANLVTLKTELDGWGQKLKDGLVDSSTRKVVTADTKGGALTVEKLKTMTSQQLAADPELMKQADQLLQRQGA